MPVRQPDARDLAQRRVRLLRGHRRDARADTALLRGSRERRRLRLRRLGRAALANQLIDGRHSETGSPLAGRIGRETDGGAVALAEPRHGSETPEVPQTSSVTRKLNRRPPFIGISGRPRASLQCGVRRWSRWSSSAQRGSRSSRSASAILAVRRARMTSDARVAEAIASLASGMQETLRDLTDSVAASEPGVAARLPERLSGELAASLDLDEVTERTLEAAGSVPGVDAAVIDSAGPGGARIRGRSASRPRRRRRRPSASRRTTTCARSRWSTAIDSTTSTSRPRSSGAGSSCPSAPTARRSGA